ncbi:kelch repeat-containing protein [Toxoplasma gondii TgCatPRC2]|uniref:Kelch repeat-containing protein n=1 Tax=Toxoplasma gondii TgCatPRC2 TaxID=1130821 RepID=A0A151HAS2_TOXGO|nr:kelch repeat-containing protein [Toxoplasma gondii TgCatPRC2]
MVTKAGSPSEDGPSRKSNAEGSKITDETSTTLAAGDGDSDETSGDETAERAALRGGTGGGARKLSRVGKEVQRRTSKMINTINTKFKREYSRGLQMQGIVPAADDMATAANSTSTGFFSPPSFQLTQIIHDSRCFLPRVGHVCVASGGDILIFGGVDHKQTVTNDFLRYVPGLNVFEPIKAQGDIPSARSFCTIVPCVASGTNREQLILFGGCDDGEQLSTTYKYDPPMRTWTAVQTEHKPPARHGHVALVNDGRVYIHGGYDGDRVMDDMWQFAGADWTQVQYRSPKGAAPGTQLAETIAMPARTGHSACMWLHSRHKVPCFYFFGGDVSGTGSATNDLWIFTLSTCRWNQIVDYAGSAPPPRFKHGSCIFDNHWMLVCGGVNHGWFRDSVLGDMYAYDMQANCWFSITVQSVLSPANVELSNLTVIQSTRAIYSFGAREEGTNSSVATCDVFRLSPLVTFVSFSALRLQVEALDEIVKLTTETQSAEKVAKLAQMQNAISKLTEEMAAIREENESLKKRLSEVERLVPR